MWGGNNEGLLNQPAAKCSARAVVLPHFQRTKDMEQYPRVQHVQGPFQRDYGRKKWGMEGLKLYATGDSFKGYATLV